jgi:hypothetical protein
VSAQENRRWVRERVYRQYGTVIDDWVLLALMELELSEPHVLLLACRRVR